MNQKILKSIEEIGPYLKDRGCHKIFLVAGKSFDGSKPAEYFESLKDFGVVRFSDYHANPDYGDCVKATKLFNEEKCDCIVAIGGGSCMDSAKCVKMYATMDPDKEYLKQELKANDIPFVAVPTTAGTGSEATRYAIFYVNGKKTSISDYSTIPEAVVFDASLLKSLPLYQKKATMLDALCHAIESYWSVKATDESKAYADEAIRLVFQHLDPYLKNEDEGNEGMLKAAYLAGKAINVTQTTAGHALCYRLTTKYKEAHGHSVAMVMKELFPYVVDHASLANDPRGEAYLKDTLQQIAEAMGCKDAQEASDKFRDLFEKLEMGVPEIKEEDYEELCGSVDPEKLRSNPVFLDREAISFLYHNI